MPGGWWHAVINLEDSIAYTQNFMSHQSFEKIWKCLRVERLHLAKQLLFALKEREPELYKKAIKLNEEEEFIMDEEGEKENNCHKGNAQEVIVLGNLDNLDLLNELSDIEKTRKFSDSSEIEESDPEN